MTIRRDQHLFSLMDSCWDGGFKVEIPEFNSDLNGEVFTDWLSTVERVFDLKDVSEIKKVKLVAVDLQGRASGLVRSTYYDASKRRQT